MKTSILSSGSFLPPTIVNSDEIFSGINLEHNFGIPNNWMSKKMGIIERRLSPSGTRPSSLAVEAAKRALESNPDINPDHIDLVVFCGIEKDQSEPATAHNVAAELGLNACHAFDVSNACFGFVDGIQVADSFIKTGLVRLALVVTGEVQHALYDHYSEYLESGISEQQAREVLGFFSLGDGGGAVVMGASESKNTGFQLFNNIAESKYNDLCFYRPAKNGGIEGRMDMPRIVAIGLRMQRAVIPETLKRLGWSTFDWMLNHQTGKGNYEKIVDMDLIEKKRIIRTYQKLGNVTTATFAFSFQKLLENNTVNKGDRICCCFAGSGLVGGQFGYTF